MYTDKDLELAIEKGIFSASDVKDFRCLVTAIKTSVSDEENVRLMGGFNDIFVVIASALLLFSTLWVVSLYNETLGYLTFSVLSWLLSIVLVSKRKMALPAITLLLAFIGGSYWTAYYFFVGVITHPDLVAIAISTVLSYVHWRSFRVPITVAVGTGTALYSVIILIAKLFPNQSMALFAVAFVCGCIAFGIAMYWDASDTSRTTRKSDVAFWLHLLSAPLIIHPVFLNLGILNGNDSIINMLVVIVLYILMTTVSIMIDRRAFMVSSLVYVVYALASLVNGYGHIGHSLALTGILIGASLLLLAVYWHMVRACLLSVVLPKSLREYVPPITVS
ncbi:hypothetical protein OFY17_06825 [Marinomonas sp. C2222]|uniref:DUF2157 domain-containing protein n=1 Tax=Marinomonas sargassi TaxID=2984494 RepID=A0ABT2YRV5_9GAMM|nr:hypothetical protein [Marinomonas sargassi]MCV2402606.1 hypothetical protein [Marinomonas sargassi]